MLARHPDDAQALVLLAQIALRQQRFDEAIDLFRERSAARPGDVAALGEPRGSRYASTGRLDEAIASFERAVGLDPQQPPRAAEPRARARAMQAASRQSARRTSRRSSAPRGAARAAG